MANILVIEDDADLQDLIVLHLQDDQHEVTLCTDGIAGLAKATTRNFDLILLDLGLPGLDGLELCRRMRQSDELTPIMMVTARDSELDRVLGLEIGADDYMVKPFSIRELQARIRATLRRQHLFNRFKNDLGAELSFDELYIEPAKRLVKVRDRVVDLTAKEFDLLFFLTSHPGKVYSREQLLDSVWGYSNSYYEHTINSNINRLRSKIERSPSEPNYILTVRGVGYKFRDSAQDSPEKVAS